MKNCNNYYKINKKLVIFKNKKNLKKIIQKVKERKTKFK